MALSSRELKIFNDAFKLGFSKSFEGWNGQTFKETDDVLYSLSSYTNTVEKERKQYERELEELAVCGLYHPGS